MTTANVPKLLPLRAAADTLGISEIQTRRLVNSGEIRSTHIGAKILIPVEEIARIANEGIGTRRVRKVHGSFRLALLPGESGAREVEQNA